MIETNLAPSPIELAIVSYNLGAAGIFLDAYVVSSQARNQQLEHTEQDLSNMRTLPAPVMKGLDLVFAARRAWYRLRYPRLTLSGNVMFIGKLKIRGRTRVHLDDRVRVRKTVLITGGGDVTIGPRTLLNGPWIVASEQVTIGEGSLISDCGITDNDFHNLQPALRHHQPTRQTRSAVSIGQNVWVGLSALVLKGSIIGDDSVVGAAAVVRSTVEPSVVVAGDPARVVKRFS